VGVNEVNKSFQQKQGKPENISKQTEEPPQSMGDCRAEGIGVLQRVLQAVHSANRVLPGELLRALNVTGNLLRDEHTSNCYSNVGLAPHVFT
jgi:hypothetical protein